MKFPRIFFKSKTPISELDIIDLEKLQFLNLSISDGSNNAGRIIVNKGQKIFKNQILTLPEINTSDTPLHSPCDGIIEDINLEPHLHIKDLKVLNIKIKILAHYNSIYSDTLPDDLTVKSFNIKKSSYKNIINKIRYSGIIGLGGAGFPSFKKIVNQNIQHLIINAVECEPPISADAALMSDINKVKNIITAALLLKNLLQANNDNQVNIIIAIEDNKPLAIKNFSTVINNLEIENNSKKDISVKSIKTAFPNGDAKYLTKLLLDIDIPKNKHSSSYGIVCFNVATVFSIYNAIYKNQPLTKRIVTISGSAVSKPKNYEILIGTPIIEILSFLGINIKAKNLKIIMGGEFMGVPITNFNAGILKTTNSLIINFIEDNKLDLISEECINCGFCVNDCPQNLLPQQLYKFSKNDEHNNLINNNINHCIECGICDVVCPSNIAITKYIRYGKKLINNHHIQLENSNSLKNRYENLQNRLLKAEQEKLDKAKSQSQIDKSDLLKKILAKNKDN